MTGRPLIGITGRRKRGDQLVGNLNILADFAVDIFYADYVGKMLHQQVHRIGLRFVQRHHFTRERRRRRHTPHGSPPP